jgi:galactokinase/mevalonate kinase-like predicted kinase
MPSSGTEVTVSAPGSVGILGDPGDLFGGAVLACAVGPVVTATVSQSHALEVWHEDRGTVLNWVGDLKIRGDDLDVVRAALTHLDWSMKPVKVALSGGVAPRRGLGDAAPTLVALLTALSAWAGREMSPYAIAEAACRLERDVLGLTGSLASAYVAAFGGLCFLEFHGRAGGGEQPKTYGVVEDLSMLVASPPFAVAYMGAARPVRDAVVGVRERWLAGEERVVNSYGIIARLAHEGKRALLDGDWARLGQLVNENAIIQSNLTATDSSSERLAEIALQAGALGVRPLGAGESGSVVALHLRPEELAGEWEAAGAEIVPILCGKEEALHD